MTGLVSHRAAQRIRSLTLCLVALLVAASVGLLAVRSAHAATFTVNSTGDAGDTIPDGTCDSNSTAKVTCTLREAIQEANAATATDDTVNFDIPPSACGATTGVCTISPSSGLPAVTDKVMINGYSQAGASPNTATDNTNNADLNVELIGRNAGALPPVSGLVITGSGAAGSRVQGLVINRFAGNGVFADAGAVTIDGNFIGTDPSGTLDRGNGADGVRVSSAGNLIGGSQDASQNMISGNAGNGVSVLGEDSTNNVVSGNHIGTNADATTDLGNTLSGVHVEAPGVLVGGSSADGARNIIGGNDRHGVEVDNIFAEGALVRGNLIGVNGNEFSSIGNALDGVRVSSTPEMEIGGTAAGEGNTISDNGQHGLEIVGTSSTFGKVLGNRIGTNPEGDFDFGNTIAGVRLANASSTIIGGTTAGARNVVSGNGADGVVVEGPSATGNRIEGNRIGTDAAGTQALGNRQAGVNITSASGNFVGGTAVGASNIIAGNTERGVLIAGDAAGNVVQSNFIGTNGTADLGNGEAGVEIFEGSNNVIGGTASRTGNVISGNGLDGVTLNLGASNNRVQGNLVGTGQNGATDLGNREAGVRVLGPGNTIGGTGGLARNVISGNGDAGVFVFGAGAEGNLIQGNLIGTQVDGTTPLPNFHGVFVSGASNNRIGGGVSAANTISGNQNQGVQILGGSARGNSVLGNSISDNGLLGIALKDDGVTANDTKDPDLGPNKLQNFPVITSATTTRIEGKLNSRPGKTFTIQFFASPQANFPTGFGEGEDFLGEISARTNRRGRVSFAFAAAVPTGQVVTATATDAGGNTSEFSAAKPVG